MESKNDIPNCMGCNTPMKLDKQSKAHQKSYGRKYRIRRFECDFCDYSETIYADGFRDTIIDPHKAKEDVEQMYKQMEENNE